jgi:hypothetical protein
MFLSCIDSLLVQVLTDVLLNLPFSRLLRSVKWFDTDNSVTFFVLSCQPNTELFALMRDKITN